MQETVTITSKSSAQQLDKWRITTHLPVGEVETAETISDPLTKEGFENALRRVSRKVSEPESRRT